jgi:hypothetical protein
MGGGKRKRREERGERRRNTHIHTHTHGMETSLHHSSSNSTRHLRKAKKKSLMMNARARTFFV